MLFKKNIIEKYQLIDYSKLNIICVLSSKMKKESVDVFLFHLNYQNK